MADNPGTASNVFIHRYVDIPCPSGKHRRSIVTFRNHTVAAMFCIPMRTRVDRADDAPGAAAPPSR